MEKDKAIGEINMLKKVPALKEKAIFWMNKYFQELESKDEVANMEIGMLKFNAIIAENKIKRLEVSSKVGNIAVCRFWVEKWDGTISDCFPKINAEEKKIKIKQDHPNINVSKMRLRFINWFFFLLYGEGKIHEKMKDMLKKSKMDSLTFSNNVADAYATMSEFIHNPNEGIVYKEVMDTAAQILRSELLQSIKILRLNEDILK